MTDAKNADALPMGGNVLFAGYPPQSLDKDERYTPPWVFDGLGLTFDVDAASPVDGGDCVPAHRKLTIRDDGLTAEWDGLVWLNPPFSNLAAWSARMIEHGNGVMLAPIANGAWVQPVLRAADVLWLCRDFAFVHPIHAGRHSSMPLMFAAFGDTAAEGLRRLALSGRHDGTLVTALRCAS